jgi:hypothetical protein
MPPDFLHNHAQFPALIRIVAERRAIDPALVETDYWIMHCLFGLQQQFLKFELTKIRTQGRNLAIEGFSHHRSVFRGYRYSHRSSC